MIFAPVKIKNTPKMTSTQVNFEISAAPRKMNPARKRERAENPPEQHAVLELDGDGHGRKQDGPDEHVVDAERLLDQVAADVLAERFATPHHGDTKSPKDEPLTTQMSDSIPASRAVGSCASR